jgi:hypothetical protein
LGESGKYRVSKHIAYSAVYFMPMALMWRTVGLEQTTTADTHDYTIPRYEEGQRVGAARFDDN